MWTESRKKSHVPRFVIDGWEVHMSGPGASWEGLQFRTGWSSMNSAGCWMCSTLCRNPGVQSKSSAAVPRNTWGKEAVKVSTAASMVVALVTFVSLCTNSATFGKELRLSTFISPNEEVSRCTSRGCQTAHFWQGDFSWRMQSQEQVLWLPLSWS